MDSGGRDRNFPSYVGGLGEGKTHSCRKTEARTGPGQPIAAKAIEKEQNPQRKRE